MNKPLQRGLLAAVLVFMLWGCRLVPVRNTPVVKPTQAVSTPTEDISFAISHLQGKVFYGPGPTLDEITDNLKHRFPQTYRANTDAAGIGLIEGVAEGGDCRIYLFRLTSLMKSACQPGTYTGSNTSCLEEGSALYRQCSGHIVITPSGVVEHKYTLFSVTYLPDIQVTLYIVWEGGIEVTPLRVLGDISQPSDPVTLDADTTPQFLYTLPDDRLRPIAGLPFRQPLPIDQIHPLLDALGLWETMGQTQFAADRENYPEPVIPPREEAAADILITFSGGPLDQPAGREGMLHLVPWFSTAVFVTGREDLRVGATGLDEPGGPLNAADYDFNVAKSRELFASLDYPAGFFLQMLVPDGDAELARLAELAVRILQENGYKVERVTASAEELASIARANQSKELPTIWLAR